MKKILLTMLLGVMLTGSVGAIDLVVDNEPLIPTVPAQIVNGRTLVPLRAIFEELEAVVAWDGELQKVTATKDDIVIELTINDTLAYINGTQNVLDVPATIIDGSTMVPVRFVSEALNATVYWVDETQTVRVASAVYDVVRVVDGDTIVVNYNGEEEKVRLIGIDTPESVHPDNEKNTSEGILASDYTAALLDGKQVELEFDVDMYDMYQRLLAYVYIDGVMLNKTLLEDGVAEIATYEPNVKYLDDFNAIMGVAPEIVEETVEDTQPTQTSNQVTITTPIGRNEEATVSIVGTPNTNYDITVIYSSGESSADGLEDKISDENGTVYWTWKIGGRTTLGTYDISIKGDDGSSFYTSIEIIE